MICISAASVRFSAGGFGWRLFCSQHKDEARVSRASLYSCWVLGQSALADRGYGWNRAYATIGIVPAT